MSKHSNALSVIHDVESVEFRQVSEKVHPLGLEAVDFLKELCRAHDGLIVDAVYFYSSLGVSNDKVDVSKLVHHHGNRNRPEAFTDF